MLKKILLSLTLTLCTLPVIAADKINLMLEWFVNPDHAPIIIAKQKGFFKAQNLEVNIQEPSDPSLPPKLVAAGKLDMATGYQPQLHVQVSEGLPISRIGTVIATPLNSIVVLKNGPIKNIKDLKGKKIGYSVGGFEDALVKAILNKHGLNLSDVTLVNVNWSLSPSLIAKKVDAVIGAYRNFELNQMAIEGHPGKAFYIEEEGVPAYDELIFLVNNKNRHHAKYKRFINAIELATQYIINHPDEAWNTFKTYKKDLDSELNKRAWRDTLPRFALRPGALDTARYENVAQFMKDQGLAKKTPAVSTYAIQP